MAIDADKFNDYQDSVIEHFSIRSLENYDLQISNVIDRCFAENKSVLECVSEIKKESVNW